MGPADPRRDRLFAGHQRTVRTGRLDDTAALGVLSAASALVVPSTYEGFGLPALEGMAAGVPVVAARRSSLPEVCGEAAYLVEPDGPGLAAGIEAAVAGGRRRSTSWPGAGSGQAGSPGKPARPCTPNGGARWAHEEPTGPRWLGEGPDPVVTVGPHLIGTSSDGPPSYRRRAWAASP